MPDEPTIYQQAHLAVAAVRVFVHRENRQPTVEDLAAFLGYSLEMTLHIVHKLVERGIVEKVPSAFKEVLYLRDYTKIEDLAAEGEGPTVAEKYEEVEEEKQERHAEIAGRFSPQFEDARKKDLFADLADKLKSGGKSNKPNPLDELKKKS